MRRNHKLPLLSDTHVPQSLVPALDHLTDTQLEGKWLVTVIAETMRHTIVSCDRYVVVTARAKQEPRKLYSTGIILECSSSNYCIFINTNKCIKIINLL
jgi:hypothetical protein